MVLRRKRMPLFAGIPIVALWIAHCASLSFAQNDARRDRVPSDRPPREKSPREMDLRVALFDDDSALVVYDAESPSGFVAESAESGAGSAGYVAYWTDYRTGAISVFGRRLYGSLDVGHALRNLRRDLGADPSGLLELDPELSRALSLAETEADDATSWHSVNDGVLEELLGPRGSVDSNGDAVSASVDGSVADAGGGVPHAVQASNCPPSTMGGGPRRMVPGRPTRTMSRDGILDAVLMIVGCGGSCQQCLWAGPLIELCYFVGDPDSGGPLCGTYCCPLPHTCCLLQDICCDGTCCRPFWHEYCCNDGHPHCCRNGETCCGTNHCCASNEMCCNGQCGPKGACCDFVSGSCSVTTQTCCIQQNRTYQGDGTTCTPADKCQPRCENCHSVSATFYECTHFTETEPCSQSICTANTLMTASCDFFAHRLGPPKCKTFETNIPGEVVQELYDLDVPLICTTTNPGGFHVWQTIYFGCGTTCYEQEPWTVRCDTAPCGGTLRPGSQNPRATKKACGMCQ